MKSDYQAFPVAGKVFSNKLGEYIDQIEFGLTKKEYALIMYRAAALQGILARGDNFEDYNLLVHKSSIIANALYAESEKEI